MGDYFRQRDLRVPSSAGARLRALCVSQNSGVPSLSTARTLLSQISEPSDGLKIMGTVYEPRVPLHRAGPSFLRAQR